MKDSKTNMYIKNITQKIIDFILKISKKIFPVKLYNIIHKILTVEFFLYLVFGVLTTLVNIGAFALITGFTNINENVANFIAIVMAVLFAYFTNKSLVFNSKATLFKEKVAEFVKFILGRAFTMLVELFGFYLLFNIMGVNKMVSKTIITILIIVLNFFISKFFAFKK